MFQELMPLIQGGPLTLNLTGNKDGTITVLVLPKGEGALASPLLLTATPEELDAQFPELVGQYTGSRQSLVEQMEATNAVIQAAKKESASKATKAITNAQAPASTVKDKGDGLEPDDDDSLSVTGQAAPPPAQSNSAPMPNLFDMGGE